MAAEVVVTPEELQERLDHYLRLAGSGTPVRVRGAGRPAVRIVAEPLGEAEIRERAMAMVRAGLAHWNGGRLQPREPVAKLIGDKTVADLLLEDRD